MRPGVGAAADGNHDGHGSGEAQRARARDDEHGYGRDERMGKTRLRTEESQPKKASTAIKNYRWNKIRRDAIRRVAAMGRGLRWLR